MAQIAHGQTPRSSQVLPTVKCSSCGLSVPLASLGDHVCAPLPPPNLLSLQKPPVSVLPGHKSSSVKSSEDGERLTPSRDPFQRLPPDISSPAPPHALASLPAGRISTTAPLSLQRVRSPSNAAPPAFPFPFSDSLAHPLPAHPAALSPARRDILPSRSPFTSHASPNVTPPPTILERTRTPSTLSVSRKSLDKPRPSLDKLHPSMDARRPSVEPQRTSIKQNPPTPPSTPFTGPPRTGVPPPSPGTVPFPVLPHPISVRQPPPPLSLVRPRPHGTAREIDTKTGGEAGMAGVGRRGFAAAARAALLTASLSPLHQPPGDAHRANVPQFLDSNATFSHVMRAAMTPPLSPNSAQTPSPVSPLPVSPVSLGSSPNGQHPRLPSPHDAMFPQSPIPSSSDKALPDSFPPSSVRIASPSRSPSPIPNPFERRLSGETTTQSPMPGDSLPLPFFDLLKPEFDHGSESDDESVYTMHTDLKKDDDTPQSPSADSDVGLAYAQDTDDDTPVVMPLDVRKSTASRDRRHPPGPSRQKSAAPLRSAISASSVTMSFTGPVRSRSASATTQATSTTKSVGALARAVETLIEEGASVSVLASGSVLASIGGSTSSRGPGKPSRSNTVPGPASPEQKPPKPPTRSHTSPSHPHVHAERVGIIGEVARIRNRVSAKRKDRMCVGCDSKIEDGRWIQMDGGNVLCERCWKNMYLPKCRRCNLPIERQAVSSRDGQLKGKYHKDCFNCHACQKPFPDKEFYVFDGKPFCAYHYHEANNSLCGAPSCGQPIEGPCAVTHSGTRYHPDHLICEFEDGCKEKLEEYWEVDGQMLCERHAALVNNRDGGWTRGNDPAVGTQMTKAPGTDEGRMMKRMTRFIDLGTGGDDELDIR